MRNKAKQMIQKPRSVIANGVGIGTRLFVRVPKFAPLGGKNYPIASNFSLICNFCCEYSTPKQKSEMLTQLQ